MSCSCTLAALALAFTLSSAAFAQDDGRAGGGRGGDSGGTGRGDRVSGRPFATRSEVIARHGMAATSQPLATQIALDVLRGGSAVDAAIAANAALGLMEPVSNGIGGDLFAIVWDAKTKKLYGLNASGRSAYGLTRQHLLDQGLKEIPRLGPLPVSVPGCVDGWFELHARFGRLPMSELLAPAVRYAREGFPVTELIAYYWAISRQRLADYPGFADTFLPGGQAPRKGEVFCNPKLADTLERIGTGGRDVFYKGEIADRIDAFCQRVGCFIRKRDLAEHTSTWVEPVGTNYRGYDVWELPPNGQGIAALQMLNILEGYDLKSLGHNSAAYLHLHVEAKKLVFEDRARWYADPDFARVPLATLLSKEYAAARRKLIDPEKAADRYPFGEIDLEADRRLAEADAKLRDGDTIYLCVADAEHNMVSLIQSNYRGFGCGLCPDGLGFCLQDRGELFTLEEGHPNVYEPHKRPFHTIIPAFMTRDGQPLMAFGVMGGDMQPQGHVQIVCNLVDFGMNLQEAGDAARWYHTGSSEPTGVIPPVPPNRDGPGRGSTNRDRQGTEPPSSATAPSAAPPNRDRPGAETATRPPPPEVMLDGGKLALESGIGGAVRAALEKLGHKLRRAAGDFGGYQAIWYDAANGVYFGASESRKDGQAAGY